MSNGTPNKTTSGVAPTTSTAALTNTNLMTYGVALDLDGHLLRHRPDALRDATPLGACAHGFVCFTAFFFFGPCFSASSESILAGGTTSHQRCSTSSSSTSPSFEE